MRTAIFHNFMDNIGGAEMVGLTLARELDADFYTTNIDRKKIRKMGFSDIRLKSIGPVPINAPFRQQCAAWRFRRLNLKKKYDLMIIDGDWAMAGAVRNKPNLWYVHSPIREIWDLYKYTRQNSVSALKRPFFDVWVHFNRFLNRRYLPHVTKIACNSATTQARVKTYLKREAVVIHPPVDTSAFRCGPYGHYWLSVNRLITHKRIEIQLETFARLPGENLIIVGSYERSNHFKSYARKILSDKSKNVKVLSWVNREDLIDLYAGCKGVISTAKEEDFGLTAVEAMASGKPVIAPNEGGYKETIIPGKTGLLIDKVSPVNLIQAIKTIGQNPQQYQSACLQQAQKFDTKVFIQKIKALASAPAMETTA